MSIDEIHEMAITINDNWSYLVTTKREFVNASDFYRFVESAYWLGKVSEY